MKRIVALVMWTAVFAAGCHPAGKTLRVLCGSSMAEPMEALQAEFEQKTGVPVEITLGGCETLFPQVELGAPADIFIGHEPFADMLEKKGLRESRVVRLGMIKPTIVVEKGNPKHITSLKDLTRDDVRVGLPDARYSTCGEMFEKVATEHKLLDAIHKRAVYTARTHQELATALLAGSVNVVVVWNFIAAMHKDRFDVVNVGVEFPKVNVFATRVKQSTSPAAIKLMDFLDTDNARNVFMSMGYGDKPATSKSSKSGQIDLRLFCAAGVAKPIDELTQQFTKQNPSVRFETVYGGSGTLLTQIGINKKGDLYVAGDQIYMNRAAKSGLLDRAKPMATFTPVLVVPKGNPKKIRSFADLANDGVRLGLGDPEAAAIGKVSTDLLRRNGVWPAAKKNLVVNTGTVNQLAITVAAGSVDAAIIWDATLWQFKDRLDEVARGGHDSQVDVPIGILKFTGHPQIAESFVEFTTTQDAARVFEKYGFQQGDRLSATTSQ